MNFRQLDLLKNSLIDWNVNYSVYPYNGYTINEVLCQFFDAINKGIVVINDYTKWVDELLNWIKAEGLESEVVQAINKIIENGTLENIINNEIFYDLQNKIDSTTDDIEKGLRPLNVVLKDRINVESDDTARLQRTINDMKNGQALCLPVGLVVSNTIVVNSKNVKIYSETPAEINNINYSNIKFTGEGVLFANGNTTNQVTFENLVLLGDGVHDQNCFELYVHKSNINNCTISNFKGYGIHFVNKNFTKWTGENKIKDCFIHYCGVGVKITKDIENNSVYDSYLKDTIIHSCKKWVDADKMNGWRISGCHFYSSTPQTESRFIIRDTAEVVIRNNYIEIGSQEDNLFDLYVNNSKGGIFISHNELFFSNPTPITKQQVVFNIINNSACKNIVLTNNMLYTNATQENIYLLGITNPNNPIYASLVNNEFPIKQLFKSQRPQSTYELRIAQNEYHYRVNNGLVINNFSDKKKLLINSYETYEESLTDTTNQIACVLNDESIYFVKDSQRTKIASPPVYKEIEPVNNWSKQEGYFNKICKLANMINIGFTLHGGTKTDGTVIFTIPEGFKPYYHIEGVITLDDGTTGKYFINKNNGQVTINNVTKGNTIRGIINYAL